MDKNTETITISLVDFDTMLRAFDVMCNDHKGEKKMETYYLPTYLKMRELYKKTMHN